MSLVSTCLGYWQIKWFRAPLQEFHIQHSLLGDRQVIPLVDLCPASQSRQQLMHPILSVQGDQILLIEVCRTRADRNHISLENAPQLGQISKLDLRRKEPAAVRCEAGLVSSCVTTAGVPSRILRNLGILYIRLLHPTQSGQYNTGPLDASLIATPPTRAVSQE